MALTAAAQRTIPQNVELQNKDRVIAAVLAILKNEKVGSLRNMFAKYAQNGGQFVFKTPERLIPASYTAIGGNKSQYGKVGEVIITPDQSEIIKFVIESMDWATEILADEEVARIAGSITQAIDGQLDAEILAGLAKAGNTNLKYVAGMSTVGPTEASTDADLKAVWRRLGFEGNALKGMVTKNTIGVSAGMVFHIVSNNLLSLIVEVLKVYTDKNTEIFMEGSEATGVRIGNQTLIAHPYLGQTFPAGSLHERKAYDFKKTHCITLHSEAFAMAFNKVPSMVTTVDPDTGNTVMITKYQYGSGVLRPKFIVENGIAADATEYAKFTATGTGEVINAAIQTITPSTKA